MRQGCSQQRTTVVVSTVRRWCISGVCHCIATVTTVQCSAQHVLRPCGMTRALSVASRLTYFELQGIDFQVVLFLIGFLYHFQTQSYTFLQILIFPKLFKRTGLKYEFIYIFALLDLRALLVYMNFNIVLFTKVLLTYHNFYSDN